jgi:4-hydroxy-tetrahydrodipicolinate synthase
METHPLSGVYAAAVTPISSQGKPDIEAMLTLLDFYARRGCHGALLFGTTGEGPSFSPEERRNVFQFAVQIREQHPDFRLLAGTGTPSLEETNQLNRSAFYLGFDGVVTLPPYYYRTASEEGLFQWFSQVIETSVPETRWLLGYHFPKVSGVDLPTSLLQRLAEKYPNRFGGLKDSSGDLDHAKYMAEVLPGRAVLVGNDRLLADSLSAGGAGCITALANLLSPDLRKIYDAFQQGEEAPKAAARVNAARDVLDTLIPFPASVKALLNTLYDMPLWPVRPPLEPFAPELIQDAAEKLQDILAEDE